MNRGGTPTIALWRRLGSRLVKGHRRGLQSHPFLTASVTVCVMAASALAYAVHPISSKLEFIGAYPVYPEIDYGTGAQAEAIRRGEYLARLGDCIACHTVAEPGGAPFAGGLPMATPFGTFYSPNITPDEKTGIGNWTEEDFVRMMHEGIRRDGSNAFPVFPFVFFNRVRVEDLKDIWAYLGALPPVERKNQGNTMPFPFDVRFAQYGWKLLFFYPGRGFFTEDPKRSKAWNRGAYMVEGLGHCSMCHTPLNFLGATKNEYYLTGALIEGYWAPDITYRGLESAKRFQVADVFDEGKLINRAGDVRGPMADAIHDSLRYLTEDDQLAIAEYLKSVVSRQPRNIPEVKAGQPVLKRGAQVYANVCIVCHLNGEVGAPSIHDGANWERRVTEHKLSGLYKHAVEGFNKMPPKGACVTCSNEDVHAAVDYLVYRALDESRRRELASPPAASRHVSTSLAAGEKVYRQSCATCHDGGALGAPILGVEAQWTPLLRRDFDVLLTNSLRGINNMPPKGGCSECSNSEIIAAVKYMAQQSQRGRDFSLW
jgi:cytochrome c5